MIDHRARWITFKVLVPKLLCWDFVLDCFIRSPFLFAVVFIVALSPLLSFSFYFISDYLLSILLTFLIRR